MLKKSQLKKSQAERIDKRQVTLYVRFMIRNFRHKGLEAYFRTGSVRGVQSRLAGKLRLQLTALDHAVGPEDMNAPNWKLHPLRGKWRGFHAITVNGNWRLVFRFDNGDVVDVDLVDYH